MVLVQPSTTKDPGGQQEDFGKSSPLGLLILVLFFIAVFFLVKSMNKHLRKLPASFDPPEETAAVDSTPVVESTPATKTAHEKTAREQTARKRVSGKNTAGKKTGD
ncbi:hypothetical protein [Saccharothrix tamanrassetensis]|nr:hypothetical protein [Saccharothrix tamanrassetensis]